MWNSKRGGGGTWKYVVEHAALFHSKSRMSNHAAVVHRSRCSSRSGGDGKKSLGSSGLIVAFKLSPGLFKGSKITQIQVEFCKLDNRAGVLQSPNTLSGFLEVSTVT